MAPTLTSNVCPLVFSTRKLHYQQIFFTKKALTNKITTNFAFSCHSFLASLSSFLLHQHQPFFLTIFCRDRNLRSKKLSRPPLLNHHHPEDYSEGTNRHPINSRHHHTTEASIRLCPNQKDYTEPQFTYSLNLSRVSGSFSQ